MKKIISLVCVFMLLLSTGIISIFAVPAPFFAGDANLDGNRTIQDATVVQKYVAKMTDFVLLQKYVADADNDEEITVKDATLIQKAVAKIERIEGEIFPYVFFDGFYANYDSGKAMAGVPVTFTANVHSIGDKSKSFTFEFYVNDELIDKGSEESFTYTFAEAGEYDVKIKCINAFDYTAENGEYEYVVVEPYESEKPVIKAFYVNQSSFNDYEFHAADYNITFTAEAIFGKGDYEYAFLLDGEVLRDYSEENSYTFDDMPDDREEEYTLTVRVKDSSTGENFVSEDYSFRVVF